MTVALATGVSTVLSPGAQAAQITVARSFGKHGIAHTVLPRRYESSAFKAIFPEADGGFSAGIHESGPEGNKLLRFDANGNLDRSAKPGKFVESPPPEARLADGSRLVAEGNGAVAGIEELSPDGSPVAGFGNGGRSDALPFAATRILPLPSGDILVAGSGFYSYAAKLLTIQQAELALLDAGGHLVASFGQGGLVKARTELGITGEALDLLPGPEGGFLLVTGLTPEEFGASKALARSQTWALGPTGTIDKSFGEGGSVLSPISVLSAHAAADGGFLLAGNVKGSSITGMAPSEFALGRYTAQGKPDPSFAGGAGTATADFGGIAAANVVQWEGDGSVLMGGVSIDSTTACTILFSCVSTPALARFTSDGRLDPTFGSGGRVELTGLTTPPTEGNHEGVEAIATRGEGLLVAGGTGIEAFITALDRAGAALPGFGEGGTTTIRRPRRSGEKAEAVAIDSRGRTLVSGETSAGSASLLDIGAVIRYLPDGAVDRSYGTHGFAALAGRSAHAIAAGPDGSSFVLTGAGLDDTLEKLTPGGRPDGSWGSEGIVALEPEADGEERHFEAVAALPDGEAVIAGVDRPRSGKASVIVMRFSASGRPDADFGQDGVANYDFGRGLRWYPRRILLGRGGQILLAGFASRESEPSPYELGPKTLALMDLRADGTPDRGFGRRGTVTTALPGSTEATDVVRQGGGFLVAGTTRRGEEVGELLLRYRADEALDRGFARAGVAYHRDGAPEEGAVGPASCSVFAVAGHIVLVGAGSGSPVSVFSEDGKPEPVQADDRLAPGRRPKLPAGPLAAAHGNKLTLAWTTRQKRGKRYPHEPATIDLQQVTFR